MLARLLHFRYWPVSGSLLTLPMDGRTLLLVLAALELSAGTAVPRRLGGNNTNLTQA